MCEWLVARLASSSTSSSTEALGRPSSASPPLRKSMLTTDFLLRRCDLRLPAREAWSSVVMGRVVGRSPGGVAGTALCSGRVSAKAL